MAARLLPLELIDKCIGSRLWIIMKGDKVGICAVVICLCDRCNGEYIHCCGFCWVTRPLLRIDCVSIAGALRCVVFVYLLPFGVQRCFAVVVKLRGRSGLKKKSEKNTALYSTELRVGVEIAQ